MAAAARFRRTGHHVEATRLTTVQVVIVLRPTSFLFQNEMKPVLMRQPKAVFLRTWKNLRFGPDQVVAEDPARVLHSYCEPGWNHQELLVMQVPARRCPPPSSTRREALPTPVTDAAPTREIGVSKINPHARGVFQNRACFVEELDKVGDIPGRKGLAAETAASRPIPVVVRHAGVLAPGRTPLFKHALVMCHAVITEPPVRRRCRDEIYAVIFELFDEVKGVPGPD